MTVSYLTAGEPVDVFHRYCQECCEHPHLVLPTANFPKCHSHASSEVGEWEICRTPMATSWHRRAHRASSIRASERPALCEWLFAWLCASVCISN